MQSGLHFPYFSQPGLQTFPKDGQDKMCLDFQPNSVNGPHMHISMPLLISEKHN